MYIHIAIYNYYIVYVHIPIDQYPITHQYVHCSIYYIHVQNILMLIAAIKLLEWLALKSMPV